MEEPKVEAAEREMEVSSLAQLVLDISCSFLQIGKSTRLTGDDGDFYAVEAEALGLEVDVLRQFIQESHLRVLRVLRRDSGDGVKLSLESGEKDKPKAKRQKVPTFCLIKTLKTREKLTQGAPLNSQLQLVTLGTEDIGTLVTFVQHSFAPLLQAQEGHEDDTGMSSQNKRMPLIRKRLKELEVAMVQFQNNVEIPDVDLKIHPDIQVAADAWRNSKQTGSIDVDALGFTDRLNDTGFLNEIQAGVNRWIKEIQKVTTLVHEPVATSATQEVNFWCDLHRALLATQTKLTSAEVEITLAILKQAKRYLVTVTFAADHGLGGALKTVASVMNLMKDFSLHAILSATDIPQITVGINAVYAQLKKVRLADEYKLSRVLSLVELVSTDVSVQLSTVLRTTNLFQIAFDQFDEIATHCHDLFLTWHRQHHAFHELVKDLSKRRGTAATDKVRSLAEMQLDHLAIEERMKDLHEFRQQHDRLRVVIHRVLAKTPDAATSEDMLGDIHGAYMQCTSSVDVFDVSVDGSDAWKQARKTYDLCIDRVEGSIIHSLTSRLHSTSTADDMFRVFSKYNPLFFRPRIRQAVQQFQMRLIENVKEDVTDLQAKFRAHYTYSEASRMSKLRDIPPIAGAVMWSKQIERKLHMLLSRVESVLGKGWEQHVEGKALKQVSDAFLTKLDAQLIFDHWVQELVSVPTFDVRNIVLHIVSKQQPLPATETDDGVDRDLSVAFNHQIVTLFKEVRNLEWLGYRVPFTLKMIAEDAKDKYPHAMSLDASLKAYASVCKRIKPAFETLCASFVRQVRTTIAKTFAKDNEIRWHADHLAEYALDLATKVELLCDKVDELGRKQLEIESHVDAMRRTGGDDPSLQASLERIQATVDELNLAGYSNLPVFVNQLNHTIGTVLAERLERELRHWVYAFTTDSHPVDHGFNNVVTAHQVLLQNQLLVLQPSVDQARSQWLAQLERMVAAVCNLDKINSATYDAFNKPAAASASSSTSPVRRRQKRKDQCFQDVLALLPRGLLLEAYETLLHKLRLMDEYVHTWLQYQALWDMDAQRVIASVGDQDLAKWEQLVVEIKRERTMFDSVATTKCFGPMSVHFHQVQAQVNVKYDLWHTEFLAFFGDMLSAHIAAFYAQVSTKRTTLEQHTLEAATSHVVATVTMVQDLRAHAVTWQHQMDAFSSGEKVLKRQRFKFPSTWPELGNVQGEWAAFLQLLQRKTDAMESQLPQLQAKIIDEHASLVAKIHATIADWDASKPLQGGVVAPKVALERLVVFDSRLALLAHESQQMDAARRALNLVGGRQHDDNMMTDDKTGLQRTMDELTGLREVWEQLAAVSARLDELKDTLWSAIQPRKLRKHLDDVLDMLKAFPARMQQYEAFEFFMATVQAYKAMNPLLGELKSDSIRERHWKQILRLLHVTSSFTELSLRHLWDAKLLTVHDASVKDIIRTAQGEMALDEFVRQVSEHWTTFALDLVNYQNRCRIIKGWDDMFAKLDEHLNSLQSMKQSPYYRVFAEQAESWEDRLTKVQSIFDYWIDVQRRWVYLEGIFFGSADIKQQLPKEYMRFQSVDNEFVSTMKRVSHKPLILDVAGIPNLYQSLERQQDMMGSIQRALGDYLERQRAAFPRFYFVGDEDLLEMIGNSKEPKQIQRHLSKMFAGIASFDMSDGANPNLITGLVSREGELVRLRDPVDPHAHDARINVWLALVEAQMRTTLAALLEDAVAQMTDAGVNYIDWIQLFPAQIVLLATQIQWTAQMESVLKANSSDFSGVTAHVERGLHILSEKVLFDLPQETRKKYEQLITELVHQRDVSRRLSKAPTLSGPHDFQWLYHMRHYMYPDQVDPVQKLRICVANAQFSYGFEYLGVGERLVHTPLTERCYLTLTQALHFGMGGNPFGPAGTGKTESVKALGMTLGRFVLVFNCDENFDFQAMGRIFVGLCQVGAWGCFDEFNRLEERVLSAVSQQILTIQAGLSTQKKQKHTDGAKTRIELVGKSVHLHPDVGIFVTMNPGYAGRSNLPDNLKQLFRSIAMVAPDRELIAQVMLFSQGITTAEFMATKVVLLFNLCHDQLSKQPHYDFGLRALKSVLVSAGHVKRTLTAAAAATSLATIEAEALIRSICDTVVPKLVASDVSIFETLLQGVFPGTDLHPVNEPALRAKIVEVATRRQFVPHDKWVEKALQLYQVMQLRHGVMLVGQTGMGKTSAWTVLLDALELVDGKKGEAYVIDPKAISKDHLYGTLDNTTLEWSDGIFTHVLRQVLNNVRGESDKRHWIVFDGDVDPEWAENLNSVLDDNRLLTLPSGERLEIPPNVWIIMETETLQYATLATVSRCGMVWFAHDTVETCHLIDHLVGKIARDTSLRSFYSMQDDEWTTFQAAQATYLDLVRGVLLTSGLVTTCLDFALSLPHIMQVDRLRLLVSMFSLVSKGLVHIAEYTEVHTDFSMSGPHLQAFALKWLVFSILWGFGGSLDNPNRVKLAQFLTSINTAIPLPTLPTDTTLLDFEVQVKDGEWKLWSYSVPTIDLDSHRVLSTDVVVATVDTIRHVEVLRGWLHQHRPLILCGPPGSGKTMTLTFTLNSLPEFELASLNFSSGTTPDLILKTFGQYCVYKKTPQGTVLAPHTPGKWLVVFCDEINLPQADKYGTQRVITFLRQLVEQGGFWKDKLWVHLERIQFVGACNPPTDPGRVPLSSRFLRHAPVLLVDFPAYSSLKQIYGTFNRALLKLTPSLKAYHQPLTDAMVEVYVRNQTQFTAEAQPHYIYSPRELSRWTRALYEALEPLEFEMDIGTLVKLVFHESLRLFMDRLVTPADQAWCAQTSKDVLCHHFAGASASTALLEADHHPILFTTWLSKFYAQATTHDLRKHIEARLRVFYEEELNVPLVVFDSVIDHVLRIDRVLRQPLGHLLLVGESGAGKTVLSRFVSWMNGMSVFQIKLTTHYTLANFDDDLRIVLKRCGCDGERICFIFDESNALDAAFLERMNALLASGEVPGLFEDEEHVALMHACREAVRRDNITSVDSTDDDDLFKYFTSQVQRNLHVVFTMNPASGDFQSRSKTSPALFNRCVVDWFGTWSDHALAQVAHEFTMALDLGHQEQTYDGPADDMGDEGWAAAAIGGSAFHKAIVASVVQFHHAVLHTMQRLAKRHAKHNHISPRDYLEFIRHFVALYGTKRAQLEDQQLHLNVGVDKLVATHNQVADLQLQLSAKDRELREKDAQANEKLQLMVVEQNEAQLKKKDTEVLAADLALQDDEISKRKLVVEKDLSEAEPALLEAQSSVNSIRKAQLDELRALARPPNAVRLTLEAVAIMLGENSLDWTDLRKFIRKDDFIASVVHFDSDKLTAKQRQTIQKDYMSKGDEFDYEKVQRASKACGPLFKWVVSQLNYTEILHKIQPLRHEVKTLEDQSAGLRVELQEATATIQLLEQRIQSYKQEYAALISQAQVISADMASVKKKVERSVSLLSNLVVERERWENGSKQFESQMETLVGDTLVSAGFLTYLGFLDHQQRQLLVQDWRDILHTMHIPSTPGLSFIEYLSPPSQRLAWTAADLPSDSLCVENAIILTRFHRFPLIIDPSGQAARFMVNYFSHQSSTITQTSFLDSSFMKILGSAIRFGTALLVHDVDTIDPILNPVLNRELYKTGGRVLIRLAGEEIDYSPEFRLFLLTRDPSCRFSPDICSRVTFVNFTVTPSSLESQSLALLLKSEEPDVDAKRSSLLKLQGEYFAKLRDLEDALLHQINGVQGNILDDDRVIVALETMKAESADISQHVHDTQVIMDTIEQATARFQPLARACTQLFFTLETLGQVHFLYQYSLPYFLGILTDVLRATHTTTTKPRLDDIAHRLFTHIARRVSKGMLQQDKLMFGLRLAHIYVELFDGLPSEAEMDVFYHRSMLAPTTTLPALAIPTDTADRLARLASPSSPFAAALAAHVELNQPEWEAFLTHPAPELHVPAALWGDAKSAFRDLCLVSTTRPDRLPFAAEKYIYHVFNDPSFPWRGDVEFRIQVEQETDSSRGILLCSTSGFDASGRVDELADALHKKLSSVAMGSAEGFDAADKALNTAIKHGHWLLLRNVHLCPSWLVTVEKKLYSVRESAHKEFRLFLTSEIHPHLPVNLVRLCDVFVFEPPSGVKASMQRSLEDVPADRINQSPTERGRLFLVLAWFHAIVQERLRYVPIGWSKAYEFSQSDFKGACDVVDYWVDSVGGDRRAHISPDAIPWTAIKVILKESLYGGRVDNTYDQQLMDTLLDNVFNAHTYEANYPLVHPSNQDADDGVVIPSGKTKDQFTAWIASLPNSNPPSWLGLPSSVETMLVINQGHRTLRHLQLLQDGLDSVADDIDENGDATTTLFAGGGAAAAAWIQALHRKVTTWLAQLPRSSAILVKTDDATAFANPVYRCLHREVELANKLLANITSLLEYIDGVCSNALKPTSAVRDAMRSLHQDQLPSDWRTSYAIPPHISLHEWLADFSKRVAQLGHLMSLPLADVLSQRIWIGGLFAPEAFITATRQVFSLDLHCALDELELVASVHNEANHDSGGGFNVSGFHIQGIQWTQSGGFAATDALESPLDTLYLSWRVALDDVPTLRKLPVYLNAQRLVMLFEVAVDVPPSTLLSDHIWAERAVALTAWKL